MSTTTQSGIRLTDEQQAAVDTLASLRKDVQTMGGLAGVGKTTIIHALTQRLPNFVTCAYTGKAAQVLRRKGVEASTIHSLIYRPMLDEDGKVVEPVEFNLVPSWQFGAGGIIIDEASMVGQDIYKDLKTLGVPLIFIGDHGQLEPVGQAGFNLMTNPDITLETIHRNAGEIAQFANHLRQGNNAGDWISESDQVSVVEGVDDIDFDEVDQMICAYNRTRVEINKTVRDHMGRDASRPEVGDRVMCLQNDREMRVFNGMQGILTKIDTGYLTFDNGENEFKCRYTLDGFNSEAKPEYRRGVIPFDYAYCVTAHKAQGDEWDHVLVVEQRCGAWDHKRWAYTAASRARTKLTWVLG